MVDKKDRRGLTSLMLVTFIFIVFFVVTFLGVLIFGVNIIDDAFSSVDITVGEVSFNTTYNNTLKAGLDTIVEISDNAGLFLILGMFIVMLIIGFIFSASRLWAIFDIAAIVVSFIVAVELSRAFETFINSSPTLLQIYSNGMQKSSTFMLNLPFAVVIMGALIMIVTYGILRKKQEARFE